jgi:hypothetical protein
MFLASMQRDFAARLAWSTTPDYKAANHNPEIALQSSRTITASQGEIARLTVTSRDPDGNDV